MNKRKGLQKTHTLIHTQKMSHTQVYIHNKKKSSRNAEQKEVRTRQENEIHINK